MIILKLLRFHFLLLILIYQAVNLIALHLNFCTESSYINNILDKIKSFYDIFTILLQFLVKSPKKCLFQLKEKKKFLHLLHDLNFAIKLICWIALGSASYLNMLQLPYNFLWNKNNLINNRLYKHLLDQWQFF